MVEESLCSNMCECMFLSSVNPVSYICGYFHWDVLPYYTIKYYYTWLLYSFLFPTYPMTHTIFWQSYIPYNSALDIQSSFQVCCSVYVPCIFWYTIFHTMMSCNAIIDFRIKFQNVDLYIIWLVSTSRCGTFLYNILYVWWSCWCIIWIV